MKKQNENVDNHKNKSSTVAKMSTAMAILAVAVFGEFYLRRNYLNPTGEGG